MNPVEKKLYEMISSEWEMMGYHKHSDIDHKREWAVMKAILIQDNITLRFVSTSDEDFPDLPKNLNEAKSILAAAKKARSILKGFRENDNQADRRISSAVSANLLEAYLKDTLKPPFARYAGDMFLRFLIQDELIFQADDET